MEPEDEVCTRSHWLHPVIFRLASIYIYFKDNVRIILPVFVDDMTFASKSEAAIDKTIKEPKHCCTVYN